MFVTAWVIIYSFRSNYCGHQENITKKSNPIYTQPAVGPHYETTPDPYTSACLIENLSALQQRGKNFFLGVPEFQAKHLLICQKYFLMQCVLLRKQYVWAERQWRLGLDTKYHLENQEDLHPNPGFLLVTPKHPT